MRQNSVNNHHNMQVLKTLIVPIIDPTSMRVHHRRDDGLWESERHLRHFSMTGFFSGFSKLDGIEARMVGRTCTIKEGIKMAQSEDLDFLHERFAITVDQPQNFTLRCHNGSSVSDTKGHE